MKDRTDIIIVGTGVAGLYCALNLPEDKEIIMLTKSSLEMSDSFLAQGGICTLKSEEDYGSFFRDTLKAGHFENDREAVRQMIRNSPETIDDLISLGVEFEKKDGQLLYTKEGAHSVPRILYHKDITGKEITQKLLAVVRVKKNITLMEYTEMIDLVCFNNRCGGIVLRTQEGRNIRLYSDYTVLAAGGVGGLYESSTNYPHLTGDSLALALRHGIEIKNINYVQIHPTTLYTGRPGRRFLISESVRGEGAYLLDAGKRRFTDELMPRDLLTQEICRQMEKESSSHVWLSVKHLGREMIGRRFPNIYERCMEEGIDITEDYIPVAPAQHYFMGGIAADLHSRTSMEHLYAVGENSCNGVHGANRLASNSLLESLVFAKTAAEHISDTYQRTALSSFPLPAADFTIYDDYGLRKEENKKLILAEMERINKNERRNNIQIKCG